jgi:hypothetical protein
MNRTTIPLLVCVCSLVSGCKGCADANAKQATEIIQLPPDQRRQALVRLSPDKQLDVYLYAATSVEPPLILANELASNGPPILPLVKDRLAAEVDERRFTQLMMILVAISASDCSLEKRQDILSVVEQAIPKMKEENRQSANHLLEAITHPMKQLPPCP